MIIILVIFGAGNSRAGTSRRAPESRQRECRDGLWARRNGG